MCVASFLMVFMCASACCTRLQVSKAIVPSRVPTFGCRYRQELEVEVTSPNVVLGVILVVVEDVAPESKVSLCRSVNAVVGR